LTETQCLCNATRNTELSVDGDTMPMECNSKHWALRWRRHNVYGRQQETLCCPLTETQCLCNATRNTELSVDGDTMSMECNSKHWALRWRRHNVYGRQKETLCCPLTETQYLWNATRNTVLSFDGDTLSLTYETFTSLQFPLNPETHRSVFYIRLRIKPSFMRDLPMSGTFRKRLTFISNKWHINWSCILILLSLSGFFKN